VPSTDIARDWILAEDLAGDVADRAAEPRPQQVLCGAISSGSAIVNDDVVPTLVGLGGLGKNALGTLRNVLDFVVHRGNDADEKN
jgi:hypothetical protein